MSQEVDEQAIRELEATLFNAFLSHDCDTANRILADDFIFTTPQNKSLTKEEWLAELASGDYRFVQMDLDEMCVQLNENVAIVSARLEVSSEKMIDKPSAKEGYTGKYLYTNVYRKIGNDWRMVLASGVVA